MAAKDVNDDQGRTGGDPAAAPFGVPVVTRLEDIQRYGYYTAELGVVLRAETTGGQYFMIRQTLNPEDAPPLHVHTREDEIWIVNSGRFRFWIGGESLATADVHDVGPGAVVYGPRDIAHSFQSLDGTGDMSILWNPAQVQSYFLGTGAAEERKDFERPDRLEDAGVYVLDRAPVNGA